MPNGSSMTIAESLKPRRNERVMDLVAAAGLNVERWAESQYGPVEIPAANPAYCYEWAFVEAGQVVLVNVWHDQIQEREGRAWCDLNPRAYAGQVRQAANMHASQRGAISKRAGRMDEAIAYAFRNGLPVRVIVGQGLRRDIQDPKSQVKSRMRLRLLDPEPWSVQQYNDATGECRLLRGAAPIYVDQFAVPQPLSPHQHDVTSKVWERDPRVRERALLRAAGKCELCHQPGFRMPDGRIYLETHHVIPLSENGPDHESNVVALCPNDHREAHHGERRDAIRAHLLELLAAPRRTGSCE